VDKAGIALAAVVGGIVFVIAMIGFVGMVTYLSVIGAVALMAALIVLGLIRLMQVKSRLVVMYAIGASVWCVAAIWAMLSGHFLVTLLGAIAGAALGGAYYLVYSARYPAAAAEEGNLREYKDEDGKTHKYILVGARQLPPALADRPIVVALMMLALFVAVFIIVVRTPSYLGTSDWIGEHTWAAAFGVLAAFSCFCLYTVMSAELKTEVEIFNQSIPDEASSTALDWMAKVCPQPFKLLGEAWTGIKDACRHVRAVSFRWS
jgi:uncharacterized membrane protein (DUF485 family)